MIYSTEHPKPDLRIHESHESQLLDHPDNFHHLRGPRIPNGNSDQCRSRSTGHFDRTINHSLPQLQRSKDAVDELASRKFNRQHLVNELFPLPRMWKTMAEN